MGPAAVTMVTASYCVIVLVQKILQLQVAAFFSSNIDKVKQIRYCSIQTHAHTHIPFSGTTRVSWHQKRKTYLDFTEQEGQWHQLGHMHQSALRTPPLNYYEPDALPAAQPTASKH